MSVHQLKMKPEFFKAAWCGDKTFEIRFNDRNFQERDEISLLEYDNDYTGRVIHGFIRYITAFEQKPGWVVFQYQMTGKSA